jgi:hypothetical protein
MKQVTPYKGIAIRLALLTTATMLASGTVAPASAEPQDGGAVVGGPVAGTVRSIAVAPAAGPVGAALAIEFRSRGYTVVDGAALPPSEDLAQLKAQGVDAVLSVRTAGGSDTDPQAVAAQINSTATGEVLAKITWQNGWGGWRGSKGSPAGRAMHKNLTQAARDITNGLVKTLL